MERVGDTLYIGGNFSSVNGQSRQRIAAFNTVTGALLSSVACTSMSGDVTCMSVKDGILYFGGSFTSVCSQPREHLAAIDVAAHALTLWAPSVTTTQFTSVTDVKAVGNRIYMGGGILSVNGVPRSFAAAVNDQGQLLDWDPHAGGIVFAIEPFEDRVFIGGVIDSLGGSPCQGIGAVDTIMGALWPWEPAWQLTSNFVRVRDIVVSGSRLYVGGLLELTSGHNAAVCLDVVTGEVQQWNPNADSDVMAMGPNGDRIYCGGAFKSIGRLPRQNGAAFSIDTRLPLAWNPRTTPEYADLWTMAVGADVVYIGGSFSGAGGGSVQYLAAVDRFTGDLVHTANANSFVNTIQMHGDAVYVGGSFTAINGQSSPYLAVLDAELELVYDWALAPNSTVAEIQFSQEEMYIGGWFEAINGVPRSRLAAIDLENNLLLPWAPEANAVVRAIRKEGDLVYVSGEFTTIDGQSRPRLAVFDFPSGDLNLWSPSVLNDAVNSVALHGNAVYVTGSFDYPNEFLLGFNTWNEAWLPWYPQFGTMYWGLAALVVGDKLFVGGNFFNHDSTPRQGLVAYDLPSIGTSVPEVMLVPHNTAWPVPTRATLHLTHPISGYVYDIGGRIVLTVSHSAAIDVSGLEVGAYVLRSDHAQAVYFIVE